MAASLVLTQAGEGSSPARCSRSLTIDNTTSAHDVAVAYCLAMAEVRVRFPLGALDFRVWESLAVEESGRGKSLASIPDNRARASGARNR
jgi:hypothetical protein